MLETRRFARVLRAKVEGSGHFPEDFLKIEANALQPSFSPLALMWWLVVSAEEITAAARAAVVYEVFVGTVAPTIDAVTVVAYQTILEAGMRVHNREPRCRHRAELAPESSGRGVT